MILLSCSYLYLKSSGEYFDFALKTTCETKQKEKNLHHVNESCFSRNSFSLLFSRSTGNKEILLKQEPHSRKQQFELYSYTTVVQHTATCYTRCSDHQRRHNSAPEDQAKNKL